MFWRAGKTHDFHLQDEKMFNHGHKRITKLTSRTLAFPLSEQLKVKIKRRIYIGR